MEGLFAKLTLADIRASVLRNIVSIQSSQDLFDDLSDRADDRALAQAVEDEVKPPPYRSATPILHRPFEDATWFNAIGWPFRHWQASRFSTGAFGVWYGSDSVETSVCETVHHWVHGLLSDAGFQDETVVGERKLYTVDLAAALLDLRPLVTAHPGLVHPDDYSEAQSVGARLHREGHPGLVTVSVRRATGCSYAVLNPAVLSNPRDHCLLSYRLEGGRVRVEKQPGVPFMELAAGAAAAAPAR